MALTSEEKEQENKRTDDQQTSTSLDVAPRRADHSAIRGASRRPEQRADGRFAKSSRHVSVPRAAKEGRSVSIAASLWKLTKYIPGSEGDGDLRRRIAAGLIVSQGLDRI